MISGSKFLLTQRFLLSLTIKQAIMKKLHKKNNSKVKKNYCKDNLFHNFMFYYKDSQ